MVQIHPGTFSSSCSFLKIAIENVYIDYIAHQCWRNQFFLEEFVLEDDVIVVPSIKGCLQIHYRFPQLILTFSRIR